MIDKSKLAIRIYGYLKEHNWYLSSIILKLIEFGYVHGTEKLESMNRFIDWAEKNKPDKSWIGAQLGHDLNGANDKFMSPRTGSY